MMHHNHSLAGTILTIILFSCWSSAEAAVFAQQRDRPSSAPPVIKPAAPTAPPAKALQDQSATPPTNSPPQTPASQTKQNIQPTEQSERQQGSGTSTTAQLPSGTTPPATAQDALPAQTGPSLELSRVGVNAAEQKALSLREAIEMALANNKDIEVARQNVRIAEFDLSGARGVYDPRFSSFSYFERAETPTANFLIGGLDGVVTQYDVTGTVRLEGLTPRGGGNYRIDFSSILLTNDSLFNTLKPQYQTALTFNYTQPVWRGRRFDNNRHLIEIAKKNLSLTDAQFRQRAIETVAGVQRTYWDLVFALRHLQIQRDAVLDARTQLEHNRRLVAKGILAPIDVVAAEAQVSSLEQNVYVALEEVSRVENGLKNLIAENPQSLLWDAALIPTDAVDMQPSKMTLAEALAAATANRPELQQSAFAREISGLDLRYYREQIKPQLDIVASYGVAGLAGTPITEDVADLLMPMAGPLRERVNQLSQQSGLPPLPTPSAQIFPDVLIGGYGQSLANLALNRFNNFRVGLQLSLPLRNRTAEAQLGRALVEGERIRTQREQLEQLIKIDVRNALQAVSTAESRLRAAAASRAAFEQQYASEHRTFNAGRSTFFLVLERQTTLMTARGNELRAQTDLNKAIAELQRATGNALETHNVVVRMR